MKKAGKNKRVKFNKSFKKNSDPRKDKKIKVNKGNDQHRKQNNVRK
jgi:hypothetical protein